MGDYRIKEKDIVKVYYYCYLKWNMKKCIIKVIIVVLLLNSVFFKKMIYYFGLMVKLVFNK